MIKFKEFTGYSDYNEGGSMGDALSKLNKWYRDNDVKIIGMKWKQYPDSSRVYMLVQIQIMYQLEEIDEA